MRAKEVVRKMFENIKSNWYLPVTEWQVYSTEEQKVGVWTDGKPLYRKVWNVVLTDMNEVINHGILNLEQCTKLFAVTTPNEQGIMRAIPSAYYQVDNTGGSWNVDIYIDNAVICIQPGESFLTGHGNKNVQITAEYTKTTDTAATPKVPYEPLHEWSTEEKLVGYWTDGKAAYEKTVSLSKPFTVTSTTGWQIVDNSLSENLTLISAELFRNNGELIIARQISASTEGLAIVAPDSPGVKIIGYTIRYTKTE